MFHDYNVEILCNTFSLNWYLSCILLLLSLGICSVRKEDTFFFLWKTKYCDVNFFIHWSSQPLRTGWWKMYVPKVCAKRRTPGLFSVNLFFLDLHQTSKEIQSLAAKEGLGKFSNCSTFGAFPHYPFEQHLVNFFF